MKKDLLIWLLFVAISQIVQGEPISTQTAYQKALEFVKGRNREAQTRDGQERHTLLFEGVASLQMVMDNDAFRVFNVGKGEGYVVVSGDDRMPDVLGYSDEGTFDAENIPDNLHEWLQHYTKQYELLQTQEGVEAVSRQSSEREAISPMLECLWDQNKPFNRQCPDIAGIPTITGCVATAMSQIMYYHQWPQKTTKRIPGYTTKTHKFKVPAIDVTTIDWDNIVPEYTDNATDAQQEAVSTLMKLCGTAIGMDYDFFESSTSLDTVIYALTTYFDYYEDMNEIAKKHYPSDLWNHIIYNELANRRPVLYGGFSQSGGHAFVIDGYDKDDYFHVNWGWGGKSNGYFLLSVLNGYNDGQSAIIGIRTPNLDPETPEAYVVLNKASGDFVFRYDNQRNNYLSNSNMETYTVSRKAPWRNTGRKVFHVRFDSSFADYIIYSMDNWFMNLDIAFIEGLEYINTSYVTSMNKLFYGCSKLTQLDDFWKLKTDLVVSMSNMFYGCHSLASIELKATNTANVTNMSNMFYECTSLVNLDLSNVNTSKVANMNGMFYGCEKLNNVYMDPKTFDTSNVTTMKRMFYKCKKLPYVNLTRFDTRNVTDMSAMFQECPIMSHLDLSSFNTANVAAMNNMFYGCSGLEKIYVSDEWSNENVTSSIGMFRGCTSLVGGEGTTYNTNHTDGGYAHVDGGIDNPGYFIYRESTGLESPSAQQGDAEDGWYTLSGIRLKEEPTQKGVYIHGGRKVVK